MLLKPDFSEVGFGGGGDWNPARPGGPANGGSRRRAEPARPPRWRRNIVLPLRALSRWRPTAEPARPVAAQHRVAVAGPSRCGGGTGPVIVGGQPAAELPAARCGPCLVGGQRRNRPGPLVGGATSCWRCGPGQRRRNRPVIVGGQPAAQPAGPVSLAGGGGGNTSAANRAGPVSLAANGGSRRRRNRARPVAGSARNR